MVTFSVSTYNNLDYLKWCIKSVRENAYFKNAPFIVHAENCNDGTNEWLEENKDKYNLEIYIEPEVKPARGIGGGMNFCASKVKTEYIIFLQSDFYVCKDFDFELLNRIKQTPSKTIVTSWRVQPNIFNDNERPGTIFVPLDAFGAYHDDFDDKSFLEWAEEFSNMNDIKIRRAEGAGGFIIKKEDWDYMGGNDSLFAPVSYEDLDLFIRMQLEGFDFIQTTKSIIWHFAGRGSHRLEENGGKSSNRQRETEYANAVKWLNKWGQMPQYDNNHFPKPIYNTNVKTRLTYNIDTNTSY